MSVLYHIHVLNHLVGRPTTCVRGGLMCVVDKHYFKGHEPYVMSYIVYSPSFPFYPLAGMKVLVIVKSE